MPSLLECQRAFAAALLDTSTTGSWGLRAYRNNAFGNWSGALANAYPIVRKIVGIDFFDALAPGYARAYPSTNGDLTEFGAHLAEFVSVFHGTQDLPYLPDVARMEWLAHLAYYAADAAPFDPRALAGVAPEKYAGLRPRLAPGSALLRSDWPLARIWFVHQDGFEGDLEVDLRAGPDCVLVLRNGWNVGVRSVTPAEYRFLDGAGRGETLGAALDAALRIDPAFDAAAALPRWVQAGAVSI